MALISPIDINQTAVGGAWSFNSQKLVGGYINQIVVEAANATTEFDVYITDEDSVIIYDTRKSSIGVEGQKALGKLNDSVSIPVKGIITIGVVNSTVATETFIGKLVLDEG